MTPDELAVMDRGKCILQLTGSRAFFSDKYDITKHKRYKQLSDYNKKNTFDVEKFVSRKLVLKKSQTIEVFDAGQIEEDN